MFRDTHLARLILRILRFDNFPCEIFQWSQSGVRLSPHTHVISKPLWYRGVIPNHVDDAERTVKKSL
jgi:hypothetical protein